MLLEMNVTSRRGSFVLATDLAIRGASTGVFGTSGAGSSRVHVSVRSGDIALSRSYLAGISIQNQIKGRICALVPTAEGILVQVDCGTTLLASITPRVCRDMALQEGDVVYCLAKTQSFTYLSGVETG